MRKTKPARISSCCSMGGPANERGPPFPNGSPEYDSSVMRIHQIHALAARTETFRSFITPLLAVDSADTSHLFGKRLRAS
jgi:hypothetical protein